MAPGPDVPTSDRNKFSCSSINVVVAVVFVTRAFPLWLQGRNLPRGRKGKYFDVIIILSHHFEINIHRGDRQTVLARARGWYFFLFFFLFLSAHCANTPTPTCWSPYSTHIHSRAPVTCGGPGQGPGRLIMMMRI